MNLLNSRNPFKESDSYVTEVSEQPERCDANPPSNGELEPRWTPPVDIMEGKANYLFIADVPGVEKSTVQVIREREVLFICGERQLESQLAAQKPLRFERPEGYFVRRFTLPDDASRQWIKARLSKGVLQIFVRKLHPGRTETEYPQRLEVSVN